MSKWKDAVKQASHYLALGQDEVYLDHNEKDFPWEFVTEVKEGGSHRLDISTSVQFVAVHPCGLSFRFYFELEPREANGKGYYMIDVDGCLSVMDALPTKAKKLFQAYLNACADKIGENVEKYQKIVKDEQEVIAALKRATR